MANPKRATHGSLAFRSNQGDLWWGWEAKNVGNHTAFPGRVAVFHADTNTTSIEIQITYLPHGGTDDEQAERRRVLGVVAETISIHEGSTYFSGFVICCGYITNLMVTGNVNVGDYLIPYTTPIGVTPPRPGLCESATNASDTQGRIIGRAYGSNTEYSKAIPAFITPWRV